MRSTILTCRNCKTKFTSIGSSFCSGQCHRERIEKFNRFYSHSSSKKKKLKKEPSEDRRVTSYKNEIYRLKRELAAAKKRTLGFRADSFFDSRAWREVRIIALVKYGRKCAACGATSGEMHVDHVKPRSKFPNLALEISNLQVLCRACNLGKSNKIEHDFRGRGGGNEND